MKNLLLLIAALMLITGCTTSKQVSRESSNVSSQSESSLQTDSNIDTETKTDTKNLKKTRVEEDCDSNYNVPGSNFTGTGNMEALLRGDTVNVENSDVKVTGSIDKSGNLNLNVTNKPKTIPVSFHRTTDTQEYMTELIMEKNLSKQSSREKKKEEKSSETETVKKEVKRSFQWWKTVFFIPILTLIVFFGYRFIKKRFYLT